VARSTSCAQVATATVLRSAGDAPVVVVVAEVAVVRVRDWVTASPTGHELSAADSVAPSLCLAVVVSVVPALLPGAACPVLGALVCGAACAVGQCGAAGFGAHLTRHGHLSGFDSPPRRSRHARSASGCGRGSRTERGGHWGKPQALGSGHTPSGRIVTYCSGLSKHSRQFVQRGAHRLGHLLLLGVGHIE